MMTDTIVREDRRVGLRRIAFAVAVAAVAAQALIAVVWWLANLNVVPAYGDTGEYLSLAQSLHPDTYRTLFYPLIVRGAESLAAWLHVGLPMLLYTAQTAVAGVAIYFLVSTVWSITRGATRWRELERCTVGGRRSLQVLITVALLTLPLVEHFATSILTDSLSVSLLLVALACLLRIMLLRRLSIPAILAAGIAVTAAEFMRPEKIYVLAPLVALAFVVVAARSSMRSRRLLAALAFCALVPAVMVTAIDRSTQTADAGRAQLSFDVRLFDRAVYPRLERLRPRLPDDVRAVITPTDAHAFDNAPNTQVEAGLILKLQAAAGGTDRLLNETTRAALACCWPAILASSFEDTMMYSAGPITLPAAYIEGTSTATWTTTRMGSAHPALTATYLWTSFAVLILVQLPLLLLWLLDLRRRSLQGTLLGCVLLLAGAALLNGAAFGTTSGTFVNVRYALPGYVLLSLCMLWAGAAAIRSLASPTEAPVQAGDEQLVKPAAHQDL